MLVYLVGWFWFVLKVDFSADTRCLYNQTEAARQDEPHPRLSSPGRCRWARISVRNVAGTSTVVREEPGRQGQVEGGGLVTEVASASYRQTDG